MPLATFSMPLSRMLVLALSLGASSGAGARDTLRVLAWEGYADADLVQAFEQRYDVTVETTFVSSDDDLWFKINHAPFDVFAVNTAELQRYIDNGLARSIDLDNIPNHARQLPRFQNLTEIAGIVRDGKVYAIPYTYSEMGLIYNRKMVETPPESMAAMWAPEFRGQVLAFNTSNHNFSMVGLLMPGANPFALSEAELRTAARELVELRRNVLTFYATADEATQLFSRYDIALVFANYGGQQVKALRDAGADIGYTIPKEGALAWLDCWAITPKVENQALAERWINYTLEQPVSERLSDRHGLANTVTPFPESRQNDKILWLQPLRNPQQLKQLWDRIISGDGPESF